MNARRTLLATLLLTLAFAGVAAASERAIVPVAGSTAGASGANFRTEVQLHNPGSGVMRGTITFVPQGDAQPATLPYKVDYEIGPKRTVRYDDIFVALGTSGLGSLDVVPSDGALPRIVVRAFDDQGNFGTRGLVVPAVKESEAPVLGYRFVLTAPSNVEAYRFNIGVRTVGGSPATLRVVEHDAAGTAVGAPFELTFPGETFRQKPGAELLGRAIVAGHSYSFETLAGAAIVYATTVDNKSNDGTLQLDRPVNRPPVIEDQTVNSGDGGAVTVTLEATDPDGDPISWSVLAAPAHGTLSALTIEEGLAPFATGTLTYTPEDGFTGTDSFSVGVSDDVNGRDSATVTVSVGSETNLAPVGVPDAYATLEGEPLSVAAPGVLANDSDPESAPLTAQLEVPPAAAASFTLNPDGSFIYVPAPSFYGKDSFAYRASDGVNVSELTNVTIKVQALNEPPVATNDAATTDEDTPIAIAVLTNDSDPELGPLTVQSVNTTGTLGSVTVGVGGSVNYNPTTSPALQALAAAASTTDTFSYTVADELGATSTATVTVTVTGVDDNPVAVADAATLLEDAAATPIAVLANDTDVDGGTMLVTAVTQGANGAVVITGGGTGLTYQPNADFCGSDSFTYTITGGATATVTVTVTCVNDVPSFTAGTGPTVLEDSAAFSGSIASAISAGPANEAGQTLTFNVTGNTNPSLFSAGPAVDASGNLTFTPAANANGSATITIALSDNGGTANGGVDTSAGQNFTITITAVNDVPSFSKGADETVLEGSGARTVNGWATTISAGPADESGQTLNFNVSNDNNALFTAQPAIDASGNLTYTLATEASGSTTVTVTLSDNGGIANGGVDTSAGQTFTITVTDINDAPSFTPGIDVTVAEDSGAYNTAWATGISKGPSPFEDGQTLTFNLTNNTSAALFSVAPAINATTGNLTFTPAADASGFADVTFTLSDDGGTANGGADTSAPVTFRINVTAVNDNPTANNDAATVAEDSGANAIDVLANDDDAPDTGETLTISSVTQGTSGGTVIITGGGTGLTYQPAANFAGTDTFTYTIGDGNGGTATATVTVSVSAVNDAPVVTVPAAQSVDQLQTKAFSPGTGNGFGVFDVEASSPQVTLSVNSGTLTLDGTAGLTFTTGDGSADATMVFTGTIGDINAALDGMIFDPVDTFTGDVTLSITVNDLGQFGSGGALQDSDTVTISVTAINDPPVNALPAAQNVNEDTTLTLSTGNANKLSISDPDAGTSTVQVALTATNGTMTLAGTAGLSFSFTDANGTGTGDGTADATMTFRGTIAEINTALDGLQFIPTPDYGGPASIQIVTNDLGNTGTGGVQSDTDTLNITVNAVNDAPVNTVPGAQTINEDATLTFTGGTAISVADDAGTNPVEITLGVTNGTLTLASVTGLNFTTGDGTADASMVFTGTLTDVNNALNGMFFTPTANYFGSAALSITTDDQGNTGGGALSDSDTVNITIDSVNDAPTDIALSNSAIDEGLASETTVGNLTTTDADTADTHTYTLVTGTGDTDNASFAIVGNQLQTTAIFDFETKSSYSVRIRTTDSGTGNLTYEEAFTITVSNVNEAPTDIALSNTSVQENQAAGTAVGNFTTTDPDTGDTHTYTLVTGTGDTDNASFAIVGSQLQTAAVFDFETKSSYSIRVRTTDNGTGSLTFEEVFTITVTNQNETPSDIALSAASIDENNAVNDTIGSFSTTDPDTGDTFTYTLVAGTGDTDNASFNISGNALRASASFNFEAKSSYSIRVRSTDAGSLFVEKQFTITIVNVPEAPVAGNDAFDTIGNTYLEVDGTDDAAQPKVYYNGNVLANDSDPDTGTNVGLTVTLVSSTPGAVVTLNSTGTFSYIPPAGATGTDSFTYNVSDGGLTSALPGTVTITLKERVWYVKNDATAGGLGRSNDPFDTLAEAETASAANDYIYVDFGDGTTTGQSAGILLKGGQHLIGEHVGLTIPIASGSFNGTAAPTSVTVAAAAPGSRPLLDDTVADTKFGVTIGNAIPAEIVGFSLAGVDNAIDLTSTGALTGSSTLTIDQNVVRSAGAEGIDINLNPGTTGTLTLAITNNSWNVAGTHTGNAIDINRAAGTLNLNVSGNTNIISNGAGAINIAGGAVANTFITGFANNSVTGNTAGAGVTISSVTFDANTTTGGIQQVAGGTIAIGVSGNPVTSGGLSITNSQGNLFFSDLDVYSGQTSGTALQLAGTGSGLTFGVTKDLSGGSSIVHSTNGPGIDASQVTLDLELEDLDVVATSTSAVSLSQSGGIFSAPSAASITKASGTGTAFSVASSVSGMSVSYAGTMNVTSGAGVSLTSNTGSTIAFTGQLTLSTGTNNAFVATGGGTVSSTNSASTLTSTTGTALNVSNTTIGGSGLTFRSISANGGSNGIILDGTGSSGGLTVNGDGSNTAVGGNATGGTIANLTGADGSTAGNGVYLNNTSNVVLRRMHIRDVPNFGIRGFNVNGFVLEYCTVNSTATGTSKNGTTDAEDEGSIAFGKENPGGINGLVGTATVTNCLIEDGFENNFKIANISGTLSQFTMTGTTIRDNSTVSPGNNGFEIRVDGNASVTADITTSTFTGNRANGIQVSTVGGQTGVVDVEIGVQGIAGSGGTFTNNNIGVNIAHGGSGVLNFDVHSGTFNSSTPNLPSPININLAAGLSSVGLMSGAITNNVITNANSPTGPGIRVTTNGTDADSSNVLTILLANNNISQIANRGIEMIARDGNSTINATVTNNTINLADPLAADAIHIASGATSTDTTTICGSLSGNAATTAGAGFYGIRIRNRFTGTTFRVPGYGGAATDADGVHDAVIAYLAAQNASTPVIRADHAVGNSGFGGGAACATP